MDIKALVKVANRLDSLGLTKEADFLDSLINKVAVQIQASVGEFDIMAAENPDKTYFVDTTTGNYLVGRTPNWIKSGGYSNLFIIEGMAPNQSEVDSFLNRSPTGRILKLGRYMGIAAQLVVIGGKVQYDSDGNPKLNATVGTRQIYSVKLEKQERPKSSPPRPASSGGGGDSSKSTTGGGGGGGGGSSKPATGGGGGGGGGGSTRSGGVDSWDKYIATAKFEKTGKVDTALNTRVRDVWQAYNPGNKEYSAFKSWYLNTVSNAEQLGLGRSHFGQEQAIALIPIISGSAMGWEEKEGKEKGVYKEILNQMIVKQTPHTFEPSRVGLSRVRGGSGYAPSLTDYKPAEEFSALPAQGQIRTDMARQPLSEYGAQVPGPTYSRRQFEDKEEFLFDDEVEEKMRQQRQRAPQAFSPAEEEYGTDMGSETRRAVSRT